MKHLNFVHDITSRVFFCPAWKVEYNMSKYWKKRILLVIIGVGESLSHVRKLFIFLLCNASSVILFWVVERMCPILFTLFLSKCSIFRLSGQPCSRKVLILLKGNIPLLTTLRMCFIRYNSWRNMLLNVLPSPILHLFEPIS